jgi:hypothetical protein
VYDYQEGRHFNFSGEVSKRRVNVYDYAKGCFVGGAPASLYHYGDGKHIQMGGNGKQFSGYDYGSMRHFSGTVTGTGVAIYDYEYNAFFNYSI